MRDALTRRVDPWQAALTGKRIAGSLDAARLPRLSALAEPVGLLQVSLDFEPLQVAGQPAARQRDSDAVRVVVGVSGRLRSTCQRCLEPVEFSADLDAAVMVTANEPADGESDALVVATGELLDTAALVEDEMLLGLPFAPAHAEGECVAHRPDDDAPENVPDSGVSPEGAQKRRDNPFAVLAALKSQDRDEN